MKSTPLAFALALALGAGAAFAQAPAIPPAKCEPKPVYPGVKAIQDAEQAEAFSKVLKAYQDCVKAYVAERKSFIEASNAAIRAAVEEHNAVINKFREDQEKAKKELGQ